MPHEDQKGVGRMNMEVTAPQVVSDIVVEEREKKENGPMSSSIDAKLGFQIRDRGIY